MSDFIIRLDDGTNHQNGGPSEDLGLSFSPAYQTPTGFTEDGSFLIITYDGGAKRRIPLRRVVDILEG